MDQAQAARADGARQPPAAARRLGDQVVDWLKDWVEDTGVDGFNLSRTVVPECFDDIIELVIPRLQERGLYKAAYQEGPLRQKLFGEPRLGNRHVAATHRHKPADAPLVRCLAPGRTGASPCSRRIANASFPRMIGSALREKGGHCGKKKMGEAFTKMPHGGGLIENCSREKPRRGWSGRPEAMAPLLAAFRQRFPDIEIHESRSSGDARRLARELAAGPFDLLMVAGGDGTISDVVDGVLRSTRPDIPLAFLPVGTGCDFVRNFNLPADPKALAAHIENAPPRKIDAGLLVSQDATV